MQKKKAKPGVIPAGDQLWAGPMGELWSRDLYTLLMPHERLVFVSSWHYLLTAVWGVRVMYEGE